MEIWRIIPTWEGLYEVSNWGRVRSVDRTVLHRKNGPTFYCGRVLRQGRSKNGYWVVALSRTGEKPKSFNVHELVLLAFVGLPPAGYECCHGPEGSWVNKISNLRWDTRKENHLDKARHRGKK